MDRASVSICRIYAALSNVLTANLTDDELEKLENKIIDDIDFATGKQTIRFGKQNASNKIEDTPTKDITDNLENKSDKNEENNKCEKLEQINNNSDKLNQANEKQFVDNFDLNNLESNNSSKELEKSKRVRWDCKSCMNISFKDSDSNSVCALCKQIFKDSGKTNTYYQRRPKEISSCCGSCNYIKYDEEMGKYLCTVNYYDENTNKITANVVRANYMNKNKPTFCRI